MKLIFSPVAEKQLKKLAKVAQIAIAGKVRNLREGNFLSTTKLAGYKNLYRTRAGNFRLVFRKSSESIYVVVLGHRKEIYKILEQLLK